MPQTVLFVVVCLVGVLLADVSRAQTADSLASSSESSRVIVPLAVGLEYFVPTLGHAYAGDWVRGLPPLAATLAGGAIIGITLIECRCLFDSPRPTTVVALSAGFVTGLAGRLWGLYSAYRTAEDHNEEVTSRLSFGPARETLGLRVAIDL